MCIRDRFFTVPGDRLKEFAKEAKARGILYVVIKDKVNPDQTEVMVFADDAATVSYTHLKSRQINAGTDHWKEGDREWKKKERCTYIC